MTYVKENHISLNEIINELNLKLKKNDYKKIDEESEIQIHLYENYDVINKDVFYELATELWDEAEQEKKEGYTKDEYISKEAFNMMYGNYQYFTIPKEQVEIWKKYDINPIFKHNKKDEFIIGFGLIGISSDMIGTNMTKKQLKKIKTKKKRMEIILQEIERIKKLKGGDK